MVLNIRRMMSKRLTIRLNIISIIFSILFLIIFLLIIIKKCKDNNNDINNIYKSKCRLIVIILTSPDNMKNRDTIRKTWIYDKNDNIKHLFAIGTLNSHTEQLETLHSEQKKYKDLLLLSKLEDSYESLTKKVLQSFQHVYQHYQFDYLLKCDDDSFVLLHEVLKNLDNFESQSSTSGIKKELYWGFFNGRAQIKKRGPWKEVDWNLCDFYLPYALGGGYILSYNLVKYLATNANYLKLFHSEDVSVGLWLSPLANIERKHDVRFDTEYRSRGCSNQYIVTHKQSNNNMKRLHDHYSTTGKLCSKEFRSRLSYEYNWFVPPSQCCDRVVGII